MAYIRKYRDKWRAEVERHGHRASQVTDTKREAQAWALKKEAELDALKGSGGKTFLDAVEKYKQAVSSKKRSERMEISRLDNMLLIIGAGTKLSQIDSSTIGRWRDERLKHVSGSTVQREANTLRNLFTIAVDEWRWIDRNPFKGVKLPAHNEARHQLWGWREIKRVLRAGERAGGKTYEMTRAFHIALRSAMRLSEVLAAPEGFNARRRVVVLDRTKTTGRDEVPVGRIAARLLQEALAAVAGADPARNAFVVDPNEGSVLFSKLCRQLMIKDLTFHDSRATGLTHLAKKVDVMTLARISRHKDINLLHRVYYRETADSIAARL